MSLDASWRAWGTRTENAGVAKGSKTRQFGAQLQTQAGILVGFLGVMWLLELVDTFLLGGALDFYGIRPRSVSALPNILAAPFLHGGLEHLAANTIPLAVLGWLVLVRAIRTFVIVTIVVIVLGGLGVWLFAAPNSIHIGASGLIFGYLGYLLLRGYFERSFLSILIALVVALVYGGALLGVLPGQQGISWEGHLFGFLGGALAAWMLAPRRVNPGFWPASSGSR